MKLINGDALQELDKLIEQNIRVNAIIGDIPYGITQNEIDIFPKDSFFKDIWKITDVFITTVDRQAMVKTINAIPKSIKWYDIIWDKEITTGFLNAKRQPLRQHEIILVMHKKQSTYNPQKWDSGKYYNARKGIFSYGKDDITNNNYGDIKKNVQTNTTMRYPTSIVKFKKLHPSVVVHPTQKPLELYEWLVKTYTNEGDTVLDPFMGSGTTGVACKQLGRNFIGIELDENYFAIANERINNETKKQ